MYPEVMQAVGTLVTIAGLVVVAPAEAGRVLPELWQWLTRQGRRLRGWASRFLPFLRNDGAINVASLHSSTNAISTSWGVLRVKLRDHGTAEDQLAAIRRGIENIHGELDLLQQGQSALKSDLNRCFELLVQNDADLRQVVEEQRQQQTRLNARGFPLAAMGALLAGTPGAWLVSTSTVPVGVTASAPTWVWWPLAAVGAVASVVAVRWLWQSRHELARGWFEGFAERAQSAAEDQEPPAPPALELGRKSQPVEPPEVDESSPQRNP